MALFSRNKAPFFLMGIPALRRGVKKKRPAGGLAARALMEKSAVASLNAAAAKEAVNDALAVEKAIKGRQREFFAAPPEKRGGFFATPEQRDAAGRLGWFKEPHKKSKWL